MTAGNSWMRNSLSQAGMTGKRRVRRVLIVDDHPIVRQGLRGRIPAASPGRRLRKR